MISFVCCFANLGHLILFSYLIQSKNTPRNHFSGFTPNHGVSTTIEGGVFRNVLYNIWLNDEITKNYAIIFILNNKLNFNILMLRNFALGCYLAQTFEESRIWHLKNSSKIIYNIVQNNTKFFFNLLGGGGRFQHIIYSLELISN